MEAQGGGGGGGTEDGRDGVGDGRWFEAREFDKLTLSWARRKEYLSYTCSAKQVALPQNYLLQLQTKSICNQRRPIWG